MFTLFVLKTDRDFFLNFLFRHGLAEGGSMSKVSMSRDVVSGTGGDPFSHVILNWQEKSKRAAAENVARTW